MDSTKLDQTFETSAAVLLGLAAIASAWAGHQAGLWGGNCLTAYTEAGQITTDASTVYQEAGAEAIRDSSLDIQAKQLVAEGSEIEDPALRDAKLDIARYLYTQQISDDAYMNLGLPASARSDDEAAWDSLPEDILLKTLEIDLDEEYWDKQLSAADGMYEAAEAKFAEGRKANGIGDQFGFVGVLLTVSMFFLGISLVFKSKARWGLLGAGGVVFVGAAIMMATLPSAGSGLPSNAAADTKKAEEPEDEPAKPEPAAEPAPAAQPPAPPAAPPPAPAPAAETGGEVEEPETAEAAEAEPEEAEAPEADG